jgi:hypothetical protein
MDKVGYDAHIIFRFSSQDKEEASIERQGVCGYDCIVFVGS